jgi:hypothetical protein
MHGDGRRTLLNKIVARRKGGYGCDKTVVESTVTVKAFDSLMKETRRVDAPRASFLMLVPCFFFIFAS